MEARRKNVIPWNKLGPHFSHAAQQPRIQDLARLRRAGRPAAQPIWRSARRFSAACENCGLGLLLCLTIALVLPAQQPTSMASTANPQAHQDPLAELSPENRELFNTLREAAQQGRDSDVVASGKKLLPALKPGTPLGDFVAQLTGTSALEVGETNYALSLMKPLADAHPDNWRVAAILARLYAESGDKVMRDQQIAHMLALHKQTSDATFAKLHTFPIQKVALPSGSAVFLYPFEPLGRENSYLIALIYTKEGKLDYRMELESADVDQAFFKPKHPGERRFSIDTFRQNATNPNWPESQALHGFVDGVFDYDAMRDRMLKTAEGEESPHK